MVSTGSVGGVFVLQRILRGNADNIKIFSKVFLLILLCFITVVCLFCVSAFIICKTDFSYEVLPTVTALILGVSSLIDGFVISKFTKENGLFWGFFAGVVVILFVAIVSLTEKTFNITANLIMRFAITVIAGAIGGIAGVNTN